MSVSNSDQPPSTQELDQRRAALDAALNSNTFARADQLKRFLRFVCEMELSGRGHEITEYSIATEALGRRSSYSPEADSTVRTSARALREKLKHLYEVEHPSAEVRIEIPKGIYTPRFVEWHGPEADQPLEASMAAAEAVTAPRPNIWKSLTILALVAGVAAGVVLSRWTSAKERAGGVDPILREAWAPWSGPGPVVLICFSTPAQLMLRSLPDRAAPAGSYAYPQELAPIRHTIDQIQGRPDAPHLFVELSAVSTTLGEALSAVKATQVLQSLRTEYNIVPTRSVKMPVIASHRAIILGNPEYSETTRQLLERATYTIRYDSKQREPVLVKRTAPAGEKPERTLERRDGLVNASFGLITVLSSDSGNTLSTLSVAGLSSAGIQAAMEFFASPSSMTELKRKMAQKGLTRFPAAYQVIVRCTAYHDQMLAYQYDSFETLNSSARNSLP